ncbi:site-specific DNA-methyltransferase, partial [bacterium]|nr:site-specific DNA-methyltransferase [bacterium]
KAKLYEFEVDEEEQMDKWDEDEIGYYKKGANLKSTGVNAPREKRPNLFYPIYISDSDTVSISRKSENDVELLPITDSKEMSWRWSKVKVEAEPFNIIVVRNGDNVSIYKKQRPEIGELPSKKPKSLFYKPEYSSGNGTAQLKKLFNKTISDFPYPKPEDLIHDFIILSTKKDDLVLDSFLGSGTTAAVAHKLDRKWIGIEMGDHAHTLCQPRLKMVVDGSEDVGITKKVGWKGGGGFKFYNLAPSLLQKDKYGNWVIDEKYNANMLSAAMCKHEGFRFAPHEELYWKQGQSTETDYIFVTTAFVTVEQLDKIHEEMNDEESLLICAKSYAPECDSRHPNITIKKIPLMILGKCEFGQDNYDLNIIQSTEEVAEEQDTNHEDYE